MIASEPLPHFVDDLLGYLHETHPTHATLDGVHTHDDLLEDVSRHGLDSEAHALAGYLRRLDEINRDGLTGIERLEGYGLHAVVVSSSKTSRGSSIASNVSDRMCAAAQKSR